MKNPSWLLMCTGVSEWVSERVVGVMDAAVQACIRGGSVGCIKSHLAHGLWPTCPGSWRHSKNNICGGGCSTIHICLQCSPPLSTFSYQNSRVQHCIAKIRLLYYIVGKKGQFWSIFQLKCKEKDPLYLHSFAQLSAKKNRKHLRWARSFIY